MSMHPTRNYFAEYKKDHEIFVETGTYKGDGIQLAIEAGYTHIMSMDILADNMQHCFTRFELETQNSNVHLTCADSGEALGKMIFHINKPVLFWLDAHSQLIEDEQDNFPLLKELQQIKKHKVKTHTILIDDILMMTHPDVTGWTLREIRSAILSINIDYKFELLPNPIRNNILVAYV